MKSCAGANCLSVVKVGPVAPALTLLCCLARTGLIPSRNEVKPDTETWREGPQFQIQHCRS